MKKLLFFLLTHITLFSGCDTPSVEPCGLRVTDDNSHQILKILFIGTSHTFVNDIPHTISLIAKSRGDSIYYAMSAPGGYDFQRHYKLKSTISAIQSQKWDFVVLQESGWRPALIESMVDTLIYPYADSLYQMIKLNSKSTKLILYMTHGYKHGASWCNEDPGVCTYKGMQKNIKRTYQHLSKQLNVPIAPAGIVWNIFMDKYPEIDLFYSDGVHANPSGSYISACTIYSYIFEKKPESIYVPKDVPENDALKIQNIIINALFNCSPAWESYGD